MNELTGNAQVVPTPNPESQQPPVQQDYFGFSEAHVYTLPDGVSWIQIESMNEGQKSEFQKLTSRDLLLDRASGNARVKADIAGERHALIKTCVKNWNMVRGGVPLAFSRKALSDFLELANPKIIEDLETEIRKANPWLLAEMSVADIDREIENLTEMRKIAQEREQGEASSSSR